MKTATRSPLVYNKMVEWLKTNTGTVEQVTGGKYFDNNHNIKESKFWVLTSKEKFL
jgi:hypothetical protein